MKRAPRVRLAPAAVDGYGDLAGQFAGSYGLTPDDWQQLILDDWLAVAGGRWASLTCGLSVPRQNGKNGVLEMRELFGMVGRGEKFLHTAHEVKTARKHFTRLKHFFGKKVNDESAKYPELNARVVELRNVNGQEAIVLDNGGSVEIVARSQGSGRGFTVDVIVCDEAQDMCDDDLEALLSTSSAAPSGDPQWIYTGTPPGPKASGEVFSRIREEALGGKARRHCWHEWSCEPDADLDSHEEWRRANPALGTRLLFEVVEGERTNLSDEGFSRERLGMWAGSTVKAVIHADTWKLRADMESVAVDRKVLALDVNPEQTRAAVSLAGKRADGLSHVELWEQRDGTGWLVPFVTDLWVTHADLIGVVVDEASPAASMIGALRDAKVNVVVMTTADVKAACGGFYDAVMNDTMRHTGQPQLASSLAGARKRALGDRWAWNRKNAASDITPIVSATNAVWAVGASKVKARRRRSEAHKSGRVLVLG